MVFHYSFFPISKVKKHNFFKNQNDNTTNKTEIIIVNHVRKNMIRVSKLESDFDQRNKYVQLLFT